MSSAPDISTLWAMIGDITRWIDRLSPTTGETALTMRVMKIGEEYGEACEAMLAPASENGDAELIKELCDVILTAGVALYTADEDAQRLFAEATTWPGANGEAPLYSSLLKVGKEYGAACQALIGVTAYNPRKGQSHTMPDLVTALCAVIRRTAFVLAYVAADPQSVFSTHLGRVHERSLGVVRLPN